VSEQSFEGLLSMIINTHREAERTRRLWRRIWIILGVTTAAYALGAWHGTVQAQTVPAYEGAALAWDYPADVQHHSGFRLTVQGIPGNTQLAKEVRQIPLADTVLKGQPLGKTYTINLIATAASPGINSAPATLTIDYQPRPRLISPTNVRTILEWQP
jgi:hypothetical protein